LSIRHSIVDTVEDMNWKENLIDRATPIRELVLQTKRIAVLGIKTESQADQPAFYVPAYLARAGFEVISPAK
jgi:predicted CoA-binding protein